MINRIKKDMKDVMKDGHIIYIKNTRREKNKMYYILWFLQKQLPCDVIRNKILFYISKIMTIEKMQQSNFDCLLRDKCMIKKKINHRDWNFHFSFPPQFPFKPPRVTLNGYGEWHIKNIYYTFTPHEKEVHDALCKIYSYFSDQWSPIIRVVNCIDYLILAIEMHDKLSLKGKKTNFLRLVDLIK